LLEGLDEIDWGSLQHAYGSAKDVPGQIRDLASRSKRHREKALWELHGNIWHQHTVYEATAPAVPFLAEVALADSVPDETGDAVILLLAEIADGESYLDVHQDFLDGGGAEIDEAALARELHWVAAAHERVREVADPFWRFLDPSVAPARRLATAYLASKFPERSEWLVPRLRELRAAERDVVARAALGLALALLGDRHSDLAQELESLPEDVVDHDVLPEMRRGLEAGGDTALASAILADLVTSTMSRLET
jgi:hypothetical protein